MRIFLIIISTVFATDRCPSTLHGRRWANIRIAVHINGEEDLRREHPKLAEVIIERVVPAVADFWQGAMRVRSVSGRLRVDRDCQGVSGDCFSDEATTCASHGGYGVKIPDRFFSQQLAVRAGAYGRMRPELIPGGEGVEADIILLVSADEKGNCSPSLDGSGVIAEAFSCRHDACGRPTMAVIHICPRGVDPDSQTSVTTLYDTLAHEMTHAFGFTANSFHRMRLPSGAPRIPFHARRTVKYTCEIDPDSNKPLVQWDVADNRDPSNTYTYTFPVGIISRVQTRDGVGSSAHGCHRCPLDPTKRYTNEDITVCLENIGHCSFAVSTPRVVKTVREFFDCPSLSGAELDNRSKQPTCRFFDSHWKQRLFGDEYMTPTTTGGAQFISPVTFAFLEDLGWYRMDYTKTTPLIQGAHWGYKEGCDFVNQLCINQHGNPVQTLSEKFFCNGRNPNPVCSANGLHKVVCDTTNRKDDIPELYRYPVNGRSSRYDFCPVYFPKRDSYCYAPQSAGWKGEVFGESSRCLDQVPTVAGDLRGMCFHIQCVDFQKSTKLTRGNSSEDSFLSDSSESVDARTRLTAESDMSDTTYESSESSFATDYSSESEDEWEDKSTENNEELSYRGYFVSYMSRNNTLIQITTPCEFHGQTISYEGGSIICANPEMICSKHIAPHMGLNLHPFGNPEGAKRAGSWVGELGAIRPFISGENGQGTVKTALVNILSTSVYLSLIITTTLALI